MRLYSDSPSPIEAPPGSELLHPLPRDALARLDALESQLWAGLGRLRQRSAAQREAAADPTLAAVQTGLQVIQEIRSRSHRLSVGAGASKG